MADRFDWLNPFASINLGIGEWADGIKGWAIANRAMIQPLDRCQPASDRSTGRQPQ